mgnify:CR=1 FL=1
MSTLFLRNKHLLFLTIAVSLVAGASSLVSLPRLEDPRITNRNPLIVTVVPGASPERVEALVTEKIEDALDEIEEIKDLESTSRAGISLVAVELDDAVGQGENDKIFSEIRDKLDQAKREFPPEAQSPLFDDQRGAVAYTLIIGVAWNADAPPELGILTRLGNELADRLRNVSGTEVVRLYGEPAEEIAVTVDPAELADLGLSSEDVARQIRLADAKAPAGVLRSARANYFMEVAGELESLERVAEVPLRGGDELSLVRLGDVAEVRRQWREPPDEIALADGKRAIFVAARMGRGQRVDVWSDAAAQVVDNFRVETGKGVLVETVFDQDRYTSARLGELAGNLLLGALVVMAVVLAMMGWRASLLVGAALPLVAALTLFLLLVAGASLHQMSIFGMIIALGLLIDNAIVVVDETRKLMLKGHRARTAVDRAVRHLFAPLLASTATTVLAFAPIPLLPGNAGDFVGMIGGSVIFALVASFAVSLTIIAALAGLYGKFSAAQEGGSWWQTGIYIPAVDRGFRSALDWGLRRPLLAMLLACSPALLGFAIAPLLGDQFFPPVDRNMFHVQVWMPRETSLGHTRDKLAEIEARIRGYDAVNRVDWLVGGSFPSVYYNLVMNQDNSPDYAHGIITAESAAAVDALVEQLQDDLDASFLGTQIVIREFGQGPPVESDVQFRILGPDIETLQALGEQMRLKLQSHPDVLHTQVTMPRGEPKLWLAADEDEARLTSFALRDLAGQLQANLEGITGGSVLEQLEEMPVRIRFASERRDRLAQVGSTNFVLPGGDWVPLEALGGLELRPELAGVTHFNGQRANTVKGYTRNDSLPINVTYAVLQQLEDQGFQLPSGYRLELGGAVEQDSEATGNLAAYAPILVTLMIATLILTFRSVPLAAMLGVVAVMCVGLALLSTWSIGFPVSFNTILGTLGLIGVGLNDSIVVLAAIRAHPQAREGDRRAIAEEVMGCSRHVLSTTLTTIGGFLPLLLLVGGDFWPSLAIVLAGGVAGATLLAVGFVPTGYVVVQGLTRRFAPRSAAASDHVLEG